MPGKAPNFGHWHLESTTGDRRSAGRHFVDLPSDVDKVTVAGMSEALPLMGLVENRSNRPMKRFELPCGGAIAETGPATDAIELTAYSSTGQVVEMHVTLTNQLPCPGGEEIDAEEIPGEEDDWRHGTNLVVELIDRHIELVNDLFDREQPLLKSDWQGQTSGLAVRPLDAALRLWQQGRNKDEPRRALIVRLAEDDTVPKLLSSVCHRPRRILARDRQLQKIDRIQEMDPACIRWLVRQPGVSLAQKAGVRQTVMSVVRYETADTHENRVVRDLVRRAVLACNRYIQENRAYPESKRVELVRTFRLELRRLLTHTPIAEVRPITGSAPPNYVLQNDFRYKPLWYWYQLFLRQEKQRDNVWRWQHRVWAEHCHMATNHCLMELLEARLLHRSDAMINFEQKTGQFFDVRMPSPLWRLPDRTVIEVIRPTATEPHGALSGVLPPCPDLLLIRRGLFGGSVLAAQGIWAVLDLDIEQDQLDLRVASLNAALGEAGKIKTSAVLLQPTRIAREASHSTARCGTATGIRLTVGSQDGLNDLAAAIQSGIGIA